MGMRGTVERPAGLSYHPGLVTPSEEEALLDFVSGLELVPVVMRGVASRRRLAHFGVGYDFDTWGVTRAEPIPQPLLDLRARCADASGAPDESYVEALVTRYPPGGSIGWHRDAAVFGSHVVGVSLASECLLRFQRRAAGGERRVFELTLAPRSAYVLAGAARWAWQHAVPAVAHERWSVTFRQLR